MPIYLDTHVVILLYAGATGKLSQAARELIDVSELLISPMVVLEIEVLREIGRVTPPAQTIVSDLERRLGLRTCDRPVATVVEHSIACSWTRDPFDRLIVGQAAVGANVLVTKDASIRQNYPHAFW
ncbi:MAG TPA: PIN domain-containing protein [Planctomycetaceae bacterium]|nr:PIN domain-containing protein [Planctomycetaceae bacterium]